MWNALVEAVYTGALLVGHPLRIAALNGGPLGLRVATGAGWDGEYALTSREAPEKFACHIAELVAGGLTAARAIRADLADEAQLDQINLELFLRTSGWARVLDSLDRCVAEHAARLDRAPVPTSAPALLALAA